MYPLIILTIKQSNRSIDNYKIYSKVEILS